MIITDRFTLLKGVSNLLDLSKNQVQDYTLDGNTPKHVFASLELKKNIIRHPLVPNAFDKIFDYVKNVKTTNDLNILVLEQYPLVTSYNRKTHSRIVNINAFNSKEIGRVSYMNLYASLVYAYTFESMVTGRLRIPDNAAQPISNFLFSLFVQLFDRDYGLIVKHSIKLPALKFILTAYVLVAFFGRNQERPTYQLAKQYSGYNYENNIDVLKKIDLTNIRGLIQGLSEIGVMPGLNLIKFTTKIWKQYDIQMLPGFEDLARFMSLIMVSSIGQQTISKTFIQKYNEVVYMQLLNIMKKKLF